MHPFFRAASWLATAKRRYGVSIYWHCPTTLCKVEPTFVSLAPFLGVSAVAPVTLKSF